MKKTNGTTLLVPGIVVCLAGLAAASPPSEFASKVSVAPGAIKHGGKAALSVTLSPRATVANGVVDLEIYNAKNVRVAQNVWQGQSLTKGKTATFHWSWKPATPGAYTVKLGVFGASWKPLHYWDDKALALPVS